MTEEPQKKLIMVAMAIVCVLAGCLLLFLLFLNRGKLIVIGKAPYTVEIPNVKTVTCVNDRCELSLIPKTYEVSIVKDGYTDQKLTVKIPLAGESINQLDFTFIPSVSIVADSSQIMSAASAVPYQKAFSNIQLQNWPTKPLNFGELPTTFKSFKISPDATTALLDNSKNIILYNFSTQKSQLLNITSGQNVFYDQQAKNLLYIDLDPKTSRQTLFLRPLNNLDQPQPITTFPRSFKNYQLFPSSDNQKILLLDPTLNTIYLIDSQQKTRTSLYSQQNITSLQWLAEDDGFLVEGQNDPTSPINQLTWFDLKTSKTQQLPFNENLTNVIPEPNHQLIIASSADEAFITYNLQNGLKTKIFTLQSTPFPNRTEASSSPNEILFQSENSINRLILRPEN
jgi:WD40 repeat protein